MNYNNHSRRTYRLNSVGSTGVTQNNSIQKPSTIAYSQLIATASSKQFPQFQQLQVTNSTDKSVTVISQKISQLQTPIVFPQRSVPAAPSAVPPENVSDEVAHVSLIPEICDIMRSFGDCEQPHTDSVRFVEKILQQQLRSLFFEASVIAMKRKSSLCPSQADFEFLMRTKPVKIARMRKHLKDMRILKKFLSMRTGRPQDFIEDLEHTGSDDELTLKVPELYDEERTRRLFRADRISQILSGQQYLEFNEARKTSFYCRHGEKIKNKFRSFLQLPADLRLPMTTMNILSYFAHETIAVIVDYAILTRLNCGNRRVEPFSRVTSTGSSAAMLYICPEVTQGRGMELVKPITVQEIHEGIRRFWQTSQNGIGLTGYGNGHRRSILAI